MAALMRAQLGAVMGCVDRSVGKHLPGVDRIARPCVNRSLIKRSLPRMADLRRSTNGSMRKRSLSCTARYPRRFAYSLLRECSLPRLAAYPRRFPERSRSGEHSRGRSCQSITRPAPVFSLPVRSQGCCPVAGRRSGKLVVERRRPLKRAIGVSALPIIAWPQDTAGRCNPARDKY